MHDGQNLLIYNTCETCSDKFVWNLNTIKKVSIFNKCKSVNTIHK